MSSEQDGADHEGVLWRDAGVAPARLTRRDALVLAGFAVFLVVLFSGVLFGPAERCLGRPEGDARNQFYCWRAYGFNEVREGRFPLWNPYEFLGMPYVASLQSAMFYPTSWLCAFLPLGLAVNLGIVVNLFLSGLFTYLWCRRLGVGWAGAAIAAGVYTFGAPQFLRIFEGHWSFLCTMTWIPCLFLCAEMLFVRGRWVPAVAGGAVGVAMQLFGGNPQYALYGGVALAAYFVIRVLQLGRVRFSRVARVCGGFGAMYGLGVLLASVQLVPALEFLGVSSRQGQLSLGWVSQYSLVPESLLTFLVADFFGSDVAGGSQYWGRFNLWEMSVYVGVVAAGLALVGVFSRRRLCLPVAGLALLMLLLALGKYTPLQAILYHTTPGFSLFRVWARFLCPFALFVGLLAGLGADAVLGAAKIDGAGGGRGGGLRWGLVVIAVVAVVFMVAGVVMRPEVKAVDEAWGEGLRKMLPQAGEPRGAWLYLKPGSVTREFSSAALADAGAGFLRSGLLLAGLGVVMWVSPRMRKRPLVPALALLALVGVDCFSFCRRYAVAFDPAEMALTRGAVAALQEAKQPFRYARAGCYAFPDGEGMRHKFCSLEGIQPNVPARFRDVFWSLQGFSKERQTTFYRLRSIGAPLRMLNLRYLVQFRDNPKERTRDVPVVYEDERFRINEMPNWWPRAWLVHDYAVVPDAGRLLEMLPRFNYEKQVLLEEEPGVAVSAPAAAEEMPRITAYESGRVALAVEAVSAGFLVLSDLHYPGWRARVDGVEARILRGNYLLRVVHVPAGRHVVEFVYAPGSFRVGLVMSLAALAGIALMVGMDIVKRRKDRNNAA